MDYDSVQVWSALAAGFIIGFIICNYILERFFNTLRSLSRDDIADMFGQYNTKDAALEEIDIRIEKHDNDFFAYRTDTDLFLAKAEDIEVLIQAIYERFDNDSVFITVTEGNGREYLVDYLKKD